MTMAAALTRGWGMTFAALCGRFIIRSVLINSTFIEVTEEKKQKNPKNTKNSYS